MSVSEPNWNNFALTKADPELAREIEQSLLESDKDAADSSAANGTLRVATQLLTTTPQARADFQQQLLRQLLGKLDVVPVKEAASSLIESEIREQLNNKSYAEQTNQSQEKSISEPATPPANIRPFLAAQADDQNEISRRHQAKWWQAAILVAATLVVLLIGFAVAMLVVKDTNSSTPTPQAAITAGNPTAVIKAGTATPTPKNTPSNSHKLNLQYPNSSAIELNQSDEAAIFPNGRPAIYQNLAIGGFETADNYAKIPDYYLTQFNLAGYVLLKNVANSCEVICARFHLTAQHGNDLVNIFVLSPDFWGRDAASGVGPIWYSLLLKKLKSGQNFILYLQGNLSATPAASPNLPPTPIPPAPVATPVNDQSVAYLSPDNQFHSGNGLIMTTPTNFQNTTTDNVDWRIETLVSDANYTCILVTLATGDQKNFFQRPEKIYSLDFSPFGYPPLPPPIPTPPQLKADNGQVYSENGCRESGPPQINTGVPNQSKYIASEDFVLGGPPLDINSRSITFLSGNLNGYQLKKPLTLPLQSFTEAKLPQVKANPNAVAAVNGIKLRVPYAYFGSDKTVLEVFLQDTTQDDLFAQSKTGVRAQVSTIGLVVTDDKNRPLGQFNQIPNQGSFINSFEPSRASIVVLPPLPADAKSLKIKLPSIELQMDYNLYNSNNQISNNQTTPTITIPLAELLKGQPSIISGTIEMEGFKIQIISATAHLDYNKQNVVINMRYQIQKTDSTKNISGLQSIPAFIYTSPINGQLRTIMIMANQRKDLSQPDPNSFLTEATVTIKNDQDLPTSLQLAFDGFAFGLNGPWQLQLNR